MVEAARKNTCKEIEVWLCFEVYKNIEVRKMYMTYKSPKEGVDEALNNLRTLIMEELEIDELPDTFEDQLFDIDNATTELDDELEAEENRHCDTMSDRDYWEEQANDFEYRLDEMTSQANYLEEEYDRLHSNTPDESYLVQDLTERLSRAIEF